MRFIRVCAFAENEADPLECNIQKVVVFQDRAEVSRSFNVKVQTGDNEFIMRNISKFIDENSVR